MAPRASAAPAGTNTSRTVAGTNTSALADSPVWSSGSGAIKEIGLHDAKTKVRALGSEGEKRRTRGGWCERTRNREEKM